MLDDNDKTHHYLVGLKELYDNHVLKISLFNKHEMMWENPFLTSSFPIIWDIEFDESLGRGTLKMRRKVGETTSSIPDYDENVALYRKERYVPKYQRDEEPINKDVSATKPRLYNVITGEPIKNTLDARLYKDTSLVIKVVDLGDICYDDRKNQKRANENLREVYNEIRVGFFLNELRYAYEKVMTEHFMVIVDWFVSNTNLYPSIDGRGPFQYIVSERLDTTLYDYLVIDHPDMLTLKCTLFCVAQALEAAWTTHRYIHFDLHFANIMIKKVNKDSVFHGKDYLYTRAYDDHQYRLPQKGHHNTLVKILDFGRNYMKIPGVPRGDDNTDLYDHIEVRKNDGSTIHRHDTLLVYRIEEFGIGMSANRTWDMRRIMWDLMTKWPVTYWRRLSKSDPEDFAHLVSEMGQFIDMYRLNELNTTYSGGEDVLLGEEKGHEGPITIEDILFSPIRELYINFRYGFDSFYIDMMSREGDNNDLLRQYRATQAKKQFGLDDIDKVDYFLKSYDLWHEIMIASVVMNDEETLMNASTFLSSHFFESLVNDRVCDTSTCTWVGQRPSSAKIPMGTTY